MGVQPSAWHMTGDSKDTSFCILVRRHNWPFRCCSPTIFMMVTSDRWAHKGFKSGRRGIQPCVPSLIAGLWFVTSVLMPSLPGHPRSLDRAMRWEQQNEWLREIPAVYRSVSLLPIPTLVGGGWAVLDPAKSLFNYFPPLEMLVCFQVLPGRHYRFHEDLSASDGLKET